MKFVLLCLCAVLAYSSGQRITTIQLDSVQYFVSRMNPYSPELNYFLAYQYCRSLGLQLASFETKEKAESMTQYLSNAGYSKYDFWTSGNRLGTGMFLWMSTGLPFNSTFDYFEDEASSPTNLEPVEQNSNTAPQRTARDSGSGLEKGCVVLKAPSLQWAPEDCSAVKDFICEQTRCYYYNYGSIPVSSAQGRPITTTLAPFTTTSTTTSTPLPFILTSTLSSLPELEPSSSLSPSPSSSSVKPTEESVEELKSPLKLLMQTTELKEPVSQESVDEVPSVEEHSEEIETEEDTTSEQEEHTTSVEQRLKQITAEIEKFSNTDSESEIGRQSFFSLSDLIKTLRPNDKKTPQIDSDYSNTMRVLGEQSIVGNEDAARNSRDSEITQIRNSFYNPNPSK